MTEEQQKERLALYRENKRLRMALEAIKCELEQYEDFGFLYSTARKALED